MPKRGIFCQNVSLHCITNYLPLLLPGISELVLSAVELAERLLRPVLRVLRQVQDLHLYLGPLASATAWKTQGSYDRALLNR